MRTLNLLHMTCEFRSMSRKWIHDASYPDSRLRFFVDSFEARYALAEITYFWPTMRSVDDGRYNSDLFKCMRLSCGLAYLHFECHVIHTDGIVFQFSTILIVGESIA
jgi:hypothetical protein